ncbi:ABC transporter ATP-binding protein [Clostridium sp.]|uniref:ABC transporter ATP-binding protein n=1 Tax=Clostridium sp. TaxID=1506 RepID=UPI002FC91B5F
MDITIKNLKKVYGDKTVLNIRELNLKAGKIYGVVGANGAGKSTLLRMIGGLETPTSGEIFIQGERLNKNHLQEITYSNQKPYLYRTTVFKNIAYPLKFRKRSKDFIDNAVDNIIKEFKIESIRNNLAVNLSGGETQKVALARALIFHPKLILLDEPTANIDPDYRELIEKVVIERNKINGSTILIITHNLREARRICDEFVFLHNGEVIEYGNIEEIFSNPKNSITKRFLATEDF